jgi:hypothetical protein
MVSQQGSRPSRRDPIAITGIGAFQVWRLPRATEATHRGWTIDADHGLQAAGCRAASQTPHNYGSSSPRGAPLLESCPSRASTPPATMAGQTSRPRPRPWADTSLSTTSASLTTSSSASTTVRLVPWTRSSGTCSRWFLRASRAPASRSRTSRGPTWAVMVRTYLSSCRGSCPVC